jgi:hypothetical protein
MLVNEALDSVPASNIRAKTPCRLTIETYSICIWYCVRGAAKLELLIVECELEHVEWSVGTLREVQLVRFGRPPWMG